MIGGLGIVGIVEEEASAGIRISRQPGQKASSER